VQIIRSYENIATATIATASIAPAHGPFNRIYQVAPIWPRPHLIRWFFGFMRVCLNGIINSAIFAQKNTDHATQ